LSSTLFEALPGRHIAQLHNDPENLAQSAFEFLEGGLRRGNSVVAIATEANGERLKARLTEARFHLGALERSGQLRFVDAAELLAEVMVDGAPVRATFLTAVRTILDRAHIYGRGTRVYQDLAGLLWQDGKPQAAIQIEDLLNEVGRTMPLALYCGYVMNTQCEESYSAPVEELGRTHNEIVASADDERFAAALDTAGKELLGISLSQMLVNAKQHGELRFPTGQRTMLWVKRNLPLSTAQIAERARRYYQQTL
jgi:MEDS: MEthanogen/methylotroph, DcmR Sensory domain